MSIRRLTYTLWLALAALLLPTLVAEARPPARKLVVVTWTDIHFGNEKYEPAAWHEAYDRGRALKPDVVVMTGDQIDNKCTKEEFLKRQDVFLSELGKRLDQVKAPVMLVYGNNDFHTNYQTDPEVLEPTTSAYKRLLGRYLYLDDLGNGVSPAKVGGMTWISINSQIFSPLNKYAGRQTQADQTFAFLEAALKKVPAGHPAVLMMHIPPSFDLYDGRLSWEPQHVTRLAALLAKHRGPLVMLSAHYHRNEIHGFQVPGRGPVPLLVAGSVSFKYGNYPNWRSSVWTLSATGAVERFDWVNRYPGHAAWDRAWTLIAPYAAATYAQLSARFGDNLEAYLRYIEDLYAHNADWKKWADDPRTRPMLVDQVAPMPATGKPAAVPVP